MKELAHRSLMLLPSRKQYATDLILETLCLITDYTWTTAFKGTPTTLKSYLKKISIWQKTQSTAQSVSTDVFNTILSTYTGLRASTDQLSTQSCNKVQASYFKLHVFMYVCMCLSMSQYQVEVRR